MCCCVRKISCDEQNLQQRFLGLLKLYGAGRGNFPYHSYDSIYALVKVGRHYWAEVRVLF